MDELLSEGDLQATTLERNYSPAVYRHFQLAPPEAPGETLGAKLWRQWETKIRPGLLWSYLRDTFSIGGAIVHMQVSLFLESFER